jgi:DNA-binding transcriptional LysR family regulator
MMENRAMHRGTLSDLATFIAVADSLSFRGAGHRLGVTASALSHSMKQLEERVGMRLVNRTTRSVSLTDAGLRLLERLRPAFDQIRHAMRELDEARGRPIGRLRIYVSSHAAGAAIAPVWNQFLSTYPEVNLEVEVGEAPIDIVARGFDAGIGPRALSAIDMIAVRVTDPMQIAVVAAPSYFAKRRPPQSPEDLSQHSCIGYRSFDGKMFAWPFEREGKTWTVPVNGRVIVNSCELALRAAVDGLGIAYVADGQADPLVRSGQLVRVLQDWCPAFEGFYLYHPSRLQMPATLRALIDTMRTAKRPPALARAA